MSKDVIRLLWVLATIVWLMVLAGMIWAIPAPKQQGPDTTIPARVAVLEVQVKELRQVVGIEGMNALDEGLQKKNRK